MCSRTEVIKEALSWLRTPYHHQGAIKGVGVDCAFLLIEVYHHCGLIPRIDPRPYPPDWHFHRSEERYLNWVKQYAVEVKAPQPADIVLYQFGRCVSHAAIVVEWPTVIHAYLKEGCILSDATKHPLVEREVGFYSLWG